MTRTIVGLTNSTSRNLGIKSLDVAASSSTLRPQSDICFVGSRSLFFYGTNI